MQAKHWLSASVGVIGLVMSAMPAGAAPVMSATTTLRIAASSSSLVEHTHWRARRYGYYYGGYYPRYPYYAYYPYLPDYYYYYPRTHYYSYYSYPRYHYYYYSRPYRYHYRHQYRM